MTPIIEQALWASAQEDYQKALSIAGLALDKVGIKEPAVIQSGAATVLIHVTKLRDQHNRTEAQHAPIHEVPRALQKSDPDPFAGIPACPKCGGAMKENENRKTDKSPHYVCLQTRGQCGKPSEKGGFFPTGAWKK